MKVKVQLPQLNKTFSLNKGDRLFHELRSEDVPVASSCGGRGICNKCMLEINGQQELSCQYKLKEDIKVQASYW